jgi:hypothetical protein
VSDEDQTRRLLWSIAGPTGPMASTEQRNEARTKLVTGDSLRAACKLLDVITAGGHPSDVDTRDLEIEAADLLSELARDPRVIEQLLLAMEQRVTRMTALDALALSGEVGARPGLAALVRSPSITNWNEAELVGLASAVGSVDGMEALESMTALLERFGGSRAIRDEVAKFEGSP